ncbi:MAG: hypothetical protein WDO73_28880 [Ignavibacteriota bacterium]
MSPDFPINGSVPQNNWGGGISTFIARINPTTAGLPGLDYSTYIGLDNTMVGCCVAVGPDGSLYAGGYTEGYLPLLPGYTPLQANYGGGFSDDYLMVLSPAASGITGVQVTQSAEPRTPFRRPRPAGGGTVMRRQ